MAYRKSLYFCLFFLIVCPAWPQPYTISTVAGTDRLLDGHAATTVPLRQPGAVALDSSGNLYIADLSDNRIRKVDSSGNIITFAGTGVAGYNGDRLKATAAQLNGPASLAFDSSGNLYVADIGNFRVRVITTDGTINTVAGNGTPGFLGDNGPATDAQLSPVAIAVDGSGNLFISTFDFRIRKIDTKGTITTIAGTGSAGYSGDNGPAKEAAMGEVPALLCDAKGDVYLADPSNGYVRMIDTAGMIHPIAGSGQFGLPFEYIPASAAVLSAQGLALDSTGNNLYISELTLDAVRVVDLTSTLIHTVAGNANTGFLGDGGPPLQAEFNGVAGLAIDAANDVYVADFGNKRIRKFNSAKIATVAGAGTGDGGLATSAFLNFPDGLAIDASNNILVADTGNIVARRFTIGGNINTFGKVNAAPHAIAVDSSGNFYVSDEEPLLLKITPAGVTSIVAGNGQSGYTGDGGAATSASIATPTGVAVDAAGDVFLTDFSNNRLRKVTASTGIVTTIAGNGNAQFSGDNGPANSAGISPIDVAVDSQGNLYVADVVNNRIRKISTGGTISTVAGNGMAGYSGDGGPATMAQLTMPNSVAVDGQGNLYIGDEGNGVVRRVNTLGLITTIAGNGTIFPASGDGGPATAAQLDPSRVTVDAMGNLYVSDSLNDRVRKLTPVVVSVASMSAVSGDKQSGTVGTALSSPLVVKVSDSTGAGVPGVVVNFTVTPAGAATVSPSPAVTLNDGTVSATVTLGTAAGNLTIQASALGSAGVSFSATANPVVSPTAPQVAAAGIVSGGLSAPPLMTVASNGIATIFGDKFAPPGTARQVGQQDLVNGKIPTNLAGVCAVFGTLLAPVLGVYPGQLNVQVPQLPPGPTTVQVITKCGTPQSESSNQAIVTIQAASPEFFYFVHNSNGHNPIAAIDAVTHGYVGAPGLVSGSTFTPAKPGDLLTLFATGFGATNPAFGSGVLPGGAAQVTAPLSITFGGIKLGASDILYVGVTQNAGLYQVNLRVPASLADGDQALVITIGGAASPAGGFITVKKPAVTTTTF